MNPIHVPARAAVLLSFVLACAAPAAAQTRQWSTPPRTEPVDPRRMGRAEVVADPGPLDPAMAGAWELRVPGGVWYRSDGTTTYRHYTPGAAMNRLRIAADGAFTWNGRQGRLVEVRPWHAQRGVRYYRIPHPDGGAYEMYLCRGAAVETLCRGSAGKLVLLFGGVGGLAAMGTRIGAPPATPSPPPGAATPATFRAGQAVQVRWQGTWYRARILQVGQGRYRVHYEGWADAWDEWVAADRVRAIAASTEGDRPR